MRSQTNAFLAALLRIQGFVTEYVAELTGPVDLTVAHQRLDEIIANLTTHALDQDANNRSAKGETEKQRQLRLALRTEQMQPIAEVARRNLRTVPEFKALQLPSRSAKGAAFVASATAMANAASTHKAALLERGLPADFLEQFQALLTQFEDSVSTRVSYRTRRMGATKGLSFEEQEGRSVLKALDALVRRALKGNEALLGTWQGARTVHYRTRRAATPSVTTRATSVGTTVPATTSATQTMSVTS